MGNNIYILHFDPVGSLYEKPFKFHRVDGVVFISVKMNKDTVEYKEKLFPGDDRDKRVVQKPRESWFRINDSFLEERLKELKENSNKLVLIYETTEDINTHILLDCHYVEND